MKIKDFHIKRNCPLCGRALIGEKEEEGIYFNEFYNIIWICPLHQEVINETFTSENVLVDSEFMVDREMAYMGNLLLDSYSV